MQKFASPPPSPTDGAHRSACRYSITHFATAFLSLHLIVSVQNSRFIVMNTFCVVTQQSAVSLVHKCHIFFKIHFRMSTPECHSRLRTGQPLELHFDSRRRHDVIVHHQTCCLVHPAFYVTCGDWEGNIYIYIYICVCVCVQGVPGGMCQTSGGCSLC